MLFYYLLQWKAIFHVHIVIQTKILNNFINLTETFGG